jgi:hypothetical protein
MARPESEAQEYVRVLMQRGVLTRAKTEALRRVSVVTHRAPMGRVERFPVDRVPWEKGDGQPSL